MQAKLFAGGLMSGAASKAPAQAGRALMKGFNLHKSPPLWAIVERERATLRREMG